MNRTDNSAPKEEKEVLKSRLPSRAFCAVEMEEASSARMNRNR
ncbi:hypothetical protein EVA_21126 [gut metagenome]|uniref:Uncharacterized protein n=1 Tax=gut metagenome TaxID=749906 RepID=J9F8J3_9ZZZZ